MSAILQLVIGLVFIYSLMAILVTQINAVISSYLNMRAKNLRESLANLISDERLQAEILSHPLIKLIDPEKSNLLSLELDNKGKNEVMRAKLTRVDYIAFDYEVCKQLRAAMPAAGVQYLGGDKAPAEVAADKLSGIDYQYSTVLSKKPEWVTEAHAGGIEVNAWTVNSTADMMACIALGVDYITTDNPATLKKLLETPFVTAPK